MIFPVKLGSAARRRAAWACRSALGAARTSRGWPSAGLPREKLVAAATSAIVSFRSRLVLIRPTLPFHEQPPQDLARRRLGDLLHDLQLADLLVRGDTLRDEPHQHIRGGFALQDHKRLRH